MSRSAARNEMLPRTAMSRAACAMSALFIGGALLAGAPPALSQTDDSIAGLTGICRAMQCSEAQCACYAPALVAKGDARAIDAWIAIFAIDLRRDQMAAGAADAEIERILRAAGYPDRSSFEAAIVELRNAAAPELTACYASNTP